MHFIRAIHVLVIGLVSFLCSSNVLGMIQLNDVMSEEDQQKTGISSLSSAQKKELEGWLNQKFVLKASMGKNMVYLSENLNGGSQIRMSDGSLYEIAPQDRQRSSLWLTPVAMTFDQSGDPNYPVKITNTIMNLSVKAKQIQPPSS